MYKFKVGDKVKITSGKDKGREGKVEKVYTGASRVLVEGLNLYKKHVKGKPGQKGGIFDIPRPLPTAKIEIICPNCKRPARVGFKIVGKEKVRMCKKCGKEMKG
uniref:Large ribosomal subunit protein uL24 n=1 Tax=uncultured Microgenomates bacterium Rifle_16ft_4_minimus_5036 TaxID=1665119 RepID=A0A0H4TU28_9BACT|nr:LSU ribosomal protein L24P [uncultured Microgenomates bacterium Rifle_16ft_4_minimus_5036]